MGLNQFQRSNRQLTDTAFIDIDPQPRSLQTLAATAVSKRQVLLCQSVSDKEPIKASLEIADTRDVAGYVSTGCGQDPGFAHLTAQLITQAVLVSQSRQTQ